MAENETKVKIPPSLWNVMEPRLRAHLSELGPERQKRMSEHGVPVFLRLHNGMEKLVHVNWLGEICVEEYRGMGYRGDASGPPLFAAEDIESWGYKEAKRQPSIFDPFKKVEQWKVLAWADGKLGDPE